MSISKQELSKNFALNVEKDRIELGLTQAEMAKILGLSTSGYKKIISGETVNINAYILTQLYHLTGKFAYQYFGESDPYLKCVSKLSLLRNNPNAINFIESIIDFEFEYAQSFQSDTYKSITLLIPQHDMYDGMIYDSCHFDKIAISQEYFKKYDFNCAIKITSNHLHPVYNTGDVILISKCPPKNGDIGVFINKDNGRAYLRKFYQTSPCKLEPINDYGETFYVDSNNPEDMNHWIKFGIVVSKVR